MIQLSKENELGIRKFFHISKEFELWFSRIERFPTVPRGFITFLFVFFSVKLARIAEYRQSFVCSHVSALQVLKIHESLFSTLIFEFTSTEFLFEWSQHMEKTTLLSVCS